MFPRSRVVWRALLSALCMVLSASATAAIEVHGDHATLAWQAASGPVQGYAVFVTRNQGPEQQHSLVPDTRVTIEGQPGDSIVVRVAAFNPDLGFGPLSEPSDTVQFSVTSDGFAAAPMDFDADGLSDVIAQEGSSGRVELWRIDGQGLLGIDPLFALLDRPIVGNGDYDGDRRADVLIWMQKIRVLGIILMKDSIVRNVENFRLRPHWEVAGSGDFDGDGGADLLLRNERRGVLEIWILDGTKLGEVVDLPADPGPSWRVVGTGDYDGDGVAEVLWHDQESTAVVAWRLDPAGTQAFQLAPQTLATHQVVGSGDFDADGRSDVVWQDQSNGVLLAWLSRDGMAHESVTLIGDANPERSLLTTGDYDGDGASELLIQNRAGAPLQAVFRAGSLEERRVELPALGPGWSVANVGEEGPEASR